jgi:hypothetical protein
MPRNQLTRDEIKMYALKLKYELHCEDVTYTSDPKSLANKYLNKLLDKIEEYRY